MSAMAERLRRQSDVVAGRVQAHVLAFGQFTPGIFDPTRKRGPA